MLRRILVALVAWAVVSSPAVASDSAGTLDPPRFAIGGGIGFTGLVHVDYQRWVLEHTSIEVGLTPLLLHNVAALAVTRHIDMAPARSANHNLVLSGTVVGIANLGGLAAGPGVRVGYELLTERFGISVAAGPGIIVGGQFSGEFLPDARLTVWGVRR